MPKRESFKWNEFKNEEARIGEIQKKRHSALFLIAETAALGIFIGFLDFNIIFPWKNHELWKRVIYFCICSQLLLICKSMHRNTKYFLSLTKDTFPTLIGIHVLTYFIFAIYFIEYPTKPFRLAYLFPFLKTKTQILSRKMLFFLLFNASTFTTYQVFLENYTSFRQKYTHIPGLFTFLKSKLPFLIPECTSAFKFSLKTNFALFVFYLAFCIPFLITSRITVKVIFDFLNSSSEIFVYMITFSFTNFVFHMFSKLIEYSQTFNSTFYISTIEIDPKSATKANEALEYFKIVSRYKKNEFKFRTHSKEASMVEMYFEKRTKEMNKILNYIRESKKRLDASLFVTIPEPNKNQTRRYRAYDTFNIMLSSLKYCIEIRILAKRFNAACEFLPECVDFVVSIREHENLNVVREPFLREFNALVEDSIDLSKRLKLNLLVKPIIEASKHLN